MKSNQGLTVAFAGMFAASFLVNCGYVWHIAGLYDRLHQSESKRINSLTQTEVLKYIETHNDSAPPANWYPNGDPWRNFTAKEANEMLEGFEDKPSTKNKVWRQVREPIQIEGSIDDGYELLDQ